MPLFKRRSDSAPRRAMATLSGVRILADTSDRGERQQLRLEVDAEPGGDRPSAFGVELHNAPDWLRLGQRLPVEVCGDVVEVDWDAAAVDGAVPTVAKSVKPPEVGIDDGNLDLGKAQRKGSACSVELREARQSTFLGLGTRNTDLTVTVTAPGMEPYGLEIKRHVIPFYAAHLVVPGTEVPGWVRDGRPDRVTIDWPAAVAAVPGIGVPAAALAEGGSDAGQAVLDRATGFAARFLPGGESAAPEASDDPEHVSGVDFDTWVAVEAGLVRDRVAPPEHGRYAEERGVPAGMWPSVTAGWNARIRTDWQLGARFGEAYQAAMKRR